VGCSVTPKCTTRRRSCDRATKTNRIRKVAVGTVKKIDAYGLRQMIGQEGSPSLGRRFAGPKQIPGHRILRHRNPQFEQFSVNAGVRPTRGWLVACAESGHECSLQLLAFRDGAAISWSNARRTLYGANGGPCRAEPSADIAANRTRIGTTKPTTAGRSGGGASDAAGSVEKPRVGDGARGSPPTGQRGFEN